MKFDEAMRVVMEQFPFPGYTHPASFIRNVYRTNSDVVRRLLPPGSTILDFGSGPCDKTAVLQLLGYQCTAWDDLEDDWHKLPGNRDKIMQFARNMGVDFRLAGGQQLPFPKETFDLIILNDVIEHMHDSPRGLLNELLTLCKPGGYLLITVPNAVNIRKRFAVAMGRSNYSRFELYYWYPGVWRGHVREYVREDMQKLADYLHLEVRELRGCDHMLYSKKMSRIIEAAYLSVTDAFDGLKDSWILVGQKPKDWKPVLELPRQEIDAILGKSTSYEYKE